MVICLERGADLHMAQVMPLPLTVSCSSKIQIGFTFLVPTYPGCPGKEAVKWLLLLLWRFKIDQNLDALCKFGKNRGNSCTEKVTSLKPTKNGPNVASI